MKTRLIILSLLTIPQTLNFYGAQIKKFDHWLSESKEMELAKCVCKKYAAKNELDAVKSITIAFNGLTIECMNGLGFFYLEGHTCQ